MIQLPRFLITAPLAAINFADSGDDWFSEFLFSNSNNLNIKKGENLITYVDHHGSRRSFNGRLIYSGIKQSTHTEILSEPVNILNGNRVLFRLAHTSTHKAPTLINIGLAIFEIEPETEHPTNPMIKKYFVLGVCQDTDNLSNTNIECIESLHGEAVGFFKGLNNKHVDVIELLHALISTTKVFANEADKYELIAKKLIGEQKGFYSYSRPKILRVVEKRETSRIVCQEATLMLLFLDSQIEVKFKLNNYSAIQDAAYISHEIKTTVIDDGSDYIKNLDFDGMVKRHLDVAKVFEVLRNEYKDRNAPPY